MALLLGQETARNVDLVISLTNTRSKILIDAIKAMYVNPNERTDSRENREFMIAIAPENNLKRSIKSLNKAHSIAEEIMEERLTRLHKLKV